MDSKEVFESGCVSIQGLHPPLCKFCVRLIWPTKPWKQKMHLTILSNRRFCTIHSVIINLFRKKTKSGNSSQAEEFVVSNLADEICAAWESVSDICSKSFIPCPFVVYCCLMLIFLEHHLSPSSVYSSLCFCFLLLQTILFLVFIPCLFVFYLFICLGVFNSPDHSALFSPVCSFSCCIHSHLSLIVSSKVFVIPVGQPLFVPHVLATEALDVLCTAHSLF